MLPIELVCPPLACCMSRWLHAALALHVACWRFRLHVAGALWQHVALFLSLSLSECRRSEMHGARLPPHQKGGGETTSQPKSKQNPKPNPNSRPEKPTQRQLQPTRRLMRLDKTK